jgi:hypothetical protein
VTDTRRLRCRLGFHRQVDDGSTARNLGTVRAPFYLVESFKSCAYCDWSSKVWTVGGSSADKDVAP